jgi:Host cell surface-exposed lipoprotein
MKRLILIPAVLVAALIFAACGSEADTDTTKDADPATTDESVMTEKPTTTETPITTEAPTATVPLEDPQITNARRSAVSYLEMMGFSRQGLIDQLSSEYGDQYPVEVATKAVDSLDVDWNVEAVEAAESYLEIDGFSHAGLVDQLSSPYGDQFTREQAEHGATVALA